MQLQSMCTGDGHVPTQGTDGRRKAGPRCKVQVLGVKRAFFLSSGDHLRSMFTTGTLVAYFTCPTSSYSYAGRTSTYLYLNSENNTCMMTETVVNLMHVPVRAHTTYDTHKPSETCAHHLSKNRS